GSLFFEQSARNINLDTLSFIDGLAGSYPNYFFIVQKKELALFTEKLQQVRNDIEWALLLKQWGLSRYRHDFWAQSDSIQQFLQKNMGIQAGVIDYTHYDQWTK
ncbi:MAG: fatty acid cis/trans isomerase, partial [Pseudobdellovibrionaceae bacterium]